MVKLSQCDAYFQVVPGVIVDTFLFLSQPWELYFTVPANHIYFDPL